MRRGGGDGSGDKQQLGGEHSEMAHEDSGVDMRGL
jgi:hypothetical protein